jgi:hypothetical protein
MDLSGYGINTTLPPGWEGRIMKRAEPNTGEGGGPSPKFASPTSTDQALAAAGRASAERTYPVVHMANFAIPDDRGDFGSGAVELMSTDNLFITLFEFGPESVGQPMFATQGMPRKLTAADFQPNVLQRTIAGQSGFQQFFTENGRAFCLFIAIGSHGNRAALAAEANAALATVVIDPH